MSPQRLALLKGKTDIPFRVAAVRFPFAFLQRHPPTQSTDFTHPYLLVIRVLACLVNLCVSCSHSLTAELVLCCHLSRLRWLWQISKEDVASETSLTMPKSKCNNIEESVAADIVKYVFTFLNFSDLRTVSTLSSYWPEFFRDRALYKRYVKSASFLVKLCHECHVEDFVHCSRSPSHPSNVQRTPTHMY